MPFQLDRWNRSPRSPLVVTHHNGFKFSFGLLDKGRRNLYLIVSERPSLWRLTKREFQHIGYWDIAKSEFVSTAPLLDREVFLSVAELIQYFVADGASSGEFDFCPVCNQKRVGPKIKREIGIMCRFR